MLAGVDGLRNETYHIGKNKNTTVYLINNQPKKWFRITAVQAIF
jgi:hypothetical protein